MNESKMGDTQEEEVDPEHNTKTDQLENEENLIISQWKFVVVFAAFITMALLNVPLAAFGILHSHLFTNNGSSSTMISWIFNGAMIIWHLSGFFAGSLCEAFGHRKVAFSAGFTLAVSTIMSGFVPNPELLFIWFSLLTGFCCGTLMATCNFIVPLYFRGRGMAMSFIYIGFSASIFFGPPMVYYLQEAFGKTSAIYLVAAIYLNICAASLTFHPIEWHQKKVTDGKVVPNRTCKTPEEILNQPATSRTLRNLLNVLKKVGKSIVNNFKMIRSFRVIIIAFSVSLSTIVQLNFLIIFPSVFIKRGVTIEKISWYLSLAGISSTVCRVALTLFIDRAGISNKWYCIFGFSASVLSSLVLSLSEKEGGIIFGAVLYGSGSMVVTSLALVIIDYMGLKYLPGTYGVWGLVNAAVTLSVGPTFGAVEDAFIGSSSFPLQYLSIIGFLCLLLWLPMPYAVKYDKKRNVLQ